MSQKICTFECNYWNYDIALFILWYFDSLSILLETNLVLVLEGHKEQ